jgi:predicted O-methyltransferase YrrM
MSLNYDQISARAKAKREAFSSLIEGIPYEEKGVLFSEMLFMLACLEEGSVPRILESGRARGQSTLILAKALPQTPIVSIEFNKDSPDVPVAIERLRGYENVELLYGDARALLPKIIQPGSVVIIDGPKMFQAIRLALTLLRTKHATQVFVHDVSKGTPERAFLDLFMPECRYSDQRDVAAVTHVVDAAALSHIPSRQQFDGFTGEYGYGFSLGCIPYVPGRSYGFLLILAFIYDACGRVYRKFGRLIGR